VAVARLQGLAHESEVDVSFDKPQEMMLGDMILHPKVIEQRLRTSLLTHHDEQRTSTKINRKRHQLARWKDVLEDENVTETFGKELFGAVLFLLVRTTRLRGPSLQVA